MRIAFVLLLATSLLAGCTAQPLTAPARPHIVLVMADDQGWGDMAYQGHPTLVTPHFDAAAANSLRFDRFYAAAPVCSPTRASVLTGRHPMRTGVASWGHSLRLEEVTLPETLREAGYTTGHFGKWHLGSVRSTSSLHPGHHGFDMWFSAPNFYDNDPIMSERGRAVPVDGESSMVAVDAAVRWMETALADDTPILTVIWFGSPHDPHRAVDEDRSHYADQPERMQHFLGEITGMDRAFGRLQSALDELGIRDDTLLWYCSDNGALPKLGSTGGHRGTKGQIYDGGLLVPAFIQWPARYTDARSISTRSNTVDIYPTLLDLLDIPSGDGVPRDGISLRPFLSDNEASRPAPMGFWDQRQPGIGTPAAQWMAELFEAQQDGRELPPHAKHEGAGELPSPPRATNDFRGHAAWIDDGWKLHRIESAERRVTLELYDLGGDPFEERDLADESAERVVTMRAALEAWMATVVTSGNGADSHH